MIDGSSRTQHAAPSAQEVSLRVQAWLEEFAACVRECRYEAARSLFSNEVIAFGTRAALAVGLAELEQGQGRKVWQVSRGFRFDTAKLCVFGDGPLFVVAIPWSSLGYAAGGEPFERSGRATIVLSVVAEQRLCAIHSHFSLDSGYGTERFRFPSDT